MTMIFRVQTYCAVCRRSNEHEGLVSTNSFGCHDLDSRPPEMMRSTMHTWVQRCRWCGYCSKDISESKRNAKKIIRTREYMCVLHNPDLNKLAASFLCQSQIDEQNGQFTAAANAVIHAAWICDDDSNKGAAKGARDRATFLIAEAERSGTDPEGIHPIVRIDLLRRAGRVREAADYLKSQEGADLEENIHKIMEFEARLIHLNDLDCHTVGEVLGEETDS